MTSEEIPDDWTDRWRDFHKPVVVGDGLVVAPSWEEDPSGGRLERIVVDPGQAFGTGAHATTRMCLELLIELAEPGRADGALADWGTGSGVLAIAAAKLGFGPVSGCDHELAALDAAEENAAANGVEIATRAAQPAQRARAHRRRPSPPTSRRPCCSRSPPGSRASRSGSSARACSTARPTASPPPSPPAASPSAAGSPTATGPRSF